MAWGPLDWLAHPSHLPVVGSLFGTTPEQENLKNQIAGLKGMYESYRPQIANAQQQGLNNRLDAFAPVNNLVGEIQGKGQDTPFFNLDPLRKNPMTQPGSPLAPTPPPDYQKSKDAMLANSPPFMRNLAAKAFDQAWTNGGNTIPGQGVPGATVAPPVAAPPGPYAAMNPANITPRS